MHTNVLSSTPPTYLPPLPGHWKERLVGLLGGSTLPTIVVALELSGIAQGGWPMYGIAGVMYAYALILFLCPRQWTPVDTWAGFIRLDTTIDQRGHLRQDYPNLCRECELLYMKTNQDTAICNWILRPPVIYNCHSKMGDERINVRLSQLDMNAVNVTHICYIPVHVTSNESPARLGYLIGALIVRRVNSSITIKWRGTDLSVGDDASFSLDVVANVQRQFSRT